MAEEYFSCFLMNPGDLQSYSAAMKNALLYADKIYTFPALDVIAKMGAEAYAGLDELTNIAVKRLRPQMEKQFRSFATMGNKPARSQRKARDVARQRLEKKIEKDVVIKSIRQSQLEDIKLRNQQCIEQVKHLEKEFKPAVEAGYIIIKDLPDNRQLADLISKAFSLPSLEFHPRILSALMGMELPRRDIELTTLYLWASQAAIMTSTLGCPLMTALPWFMEFLNGRTCLSLVSQWLEENRAGLEWKRQRLAAAINAKTLPDPAKMRIEDILELREKASDYLAPFRAQLAEYSWTIRNEPWTSGFEQEVEVLFQQRVQPAIREVERALGSQKWKKYWGRFVGYGGGAVSVGLAAHFSNFSEAQTLSILAMTIASMYGFDKLTTIGQFASHQQNGIVFMIEAKKKLG
jgi:broad specificity phosphatase PhoE